MVNKNTTLIIPSAGGPQNALFPGVYDLMIPINGKPTIDYIIEKSKNWGITKIVILLHEDDIKTRNYLDFRKSNIDLSILSVNTSSLGETILAAQDYITTDKIIIHLGDTIYSGDIDFLESHVLVEDRTVSDPQAWCFVDNQGTFINRPETYQDDYKLVIGVYYISQSNDFFKYLRTQKFYDALTSYKKDFDLVIKSIHGKYYDLGHLDEYYKSKIDFLRVRSFNSLEYDDFRGIITKKSSNTEKLLWEIQWFQKLPKDLQTFTPRLVDFSIAGKVSYSLEFYGYNSLADIFLYGDYPAVYYEKILEKILGYTTYVKENYKKIDFPKKYLEDIYIEKTFERIEKLLQDDFFKELYEKESIVINGKSYKNIKQIITKDFLDEFVNDKILKQDDFTIIHGDMCFSNILYDTFNGIFKFIDPRGKFGEVGVWGDIKYDLAKLRHSVHGKYEYIISDLFYIEVDLELGKFDFSYFNQEDNSLVDFFDKSLEKNGYDVETIKVIEGLLYLTMIPLHSDSLNRQIIMYLTAVKLLNHKKM